MKKIKLLILSHSSELGGAERSMIDLLDYWQQKGLIEPHLIVRIPLKNMVPELRKRKWKYYPIYYTNWSQRSPSSRAEDVFRNARENAKAVAAIEKLIDTIKPDMVMTNTIVSPWAAIAAAYKGLPHVWFVREYGDIDHQHIFELGREKMYEDINALSDIVVANSNTLANHVKKHVAKEKVRTLYTPFNIELLDRKINQPANNPFKLEDSLKLVVTGRIAPSKGQDEAARAVGELKKAGHVAELCIIGTPADPADSDVLNSVINNYDIADRVIFLGHQSNPLAILKHADVGIMASQQEAFGRVTFEYMVTGRPVVGANSGANPELIVNGKTGLLYEKNNTTDLVKQLSKYVVDRSLLVAHGQNARERAETMLRGKNSADNLYESLRPLLDCDTGRPRPLNFSRKWLDYPLVAQAYIDESKVMSFKRLFTIKLRALAKFLYLKIIARFNKRNGGK